MFYYLLPLSIFSDFFQWIGDFFISLVEFVQSVVMLVVNLVKGLLDFLKVLPSVLTFIVSGIENLPTVVLPFATISITVAIVLLILGRSNNS